MVFGQKETEKIHDQQKLDRETSLLKLKRERRLRKIEGTKIRHRMKKIYIVPKDIWTRNWSALLCSVRRIRGFGRTMYNLLKNGDAKNHQAVMREAQFLELEVQAATEKAQEALNLHVQISASTAIVSHED